MHCPNTPFATRLSGSAKETQLRIRSIFRWKKKRPPLWLFTLIAVGTFWCFSLVACEVRAENKTEADNFIVLSVFDEHKVWLGRSAIIPRKIARISGDIYMAEHFPEMKLRVAGVDATLVNGNYRIVFWDPSNSTYYDCSIGPRYFPVSISEGLGAIERDYVEKYK